MEAIGPKTLSLMTKAIYNYMQAEQAKPEYRANLLVQTKLEECLSKLLSLATVAESLSNQSDFKVEFKKAA